MSELGTTIDNRCPEPAEVRAQLHRMLKSRLFRHSPRLSRFFTFTVEQALNGCAEQRLKEYAIALEVFGKPEAFDPRLDSAVRVGARQLRAKIDVYYLTDGASDPVLIRYRPGDYTPRFYFRADTPAQSPLRPDTLRPALLVDKDRTNILAITDCLDGMGVPITAVVDSGERALEMMQGAGPCLVVTALNLTGSLNGAEVARAARNRPAAAAVAVIPSNVESSLLRQLLSAEPDAVVYEPVRPADLRTAVRLALWRHPAPAELASCA